MKTLKLHLSAFALFAPVFVLLGSANFFVMLLSGVYFGWLVFGFGQTKTGKKFYRSYYREIIRLENMM